MRNYLESLDASRDSGMSFLEMMAVAMGVGNFVLAGIMHSQPRFSRSGSERIPRAWRALRGWHRLAPAWCRKPHPLGTWAAIATMMA